MDMVYKYKDTFGLNDEIGACPNIEVDRCYRQLTILS